MAYYKAIVIKTGFGIKIDKPMRQNRTQKRTNTVNGLQTRHQVILMGKSNNTQCWNKIPIWKNKPQLLTLIIHKT